MRKTIQVRTDDPKNAKFNLIITGQVTKIIDVSPSTVSLNGKPGDVLKAEVEIRPVGDHFFKLLELTTRFNKGVSARIVKPTDAKSPWTVKIQSRSDKATDLYEVITVKTDSPLKPKLTIRVFATFMAPKT